MVGEREITEAVTSITWTADAAPGIVAGQLQTFDISLGPVPEVDSIAMPAEQTYSDGSVVNWNEAGEDAEHPAPVLTIGATSSDGHGTATVSASTEPPVALSDGTDVFARSVGIAGLFLGVIGLVLGVVATRKAAH